MTAPVTLQISLAPSDFRHAEILLPHQVRVWGQQVTEILLSVDFHRSAGRFSARWEEGKDRIWPLACSIAGARVVKVDYSSGAQQRVAAEFFGGEVVPAKDFRGGPYYTYFFGLAEARHDHVLHLDSDLFFGGGSNHWLTEAVQCLERHPEILFVAPLPGPPAADGRLHSQTATSEPGEAHAFRFDTMSTRLFLLDRRRFRARVGALQPRRPSALRDTVKALVEGNPPADLPEHLFTDAMRKQGLMRREFLGSHPGMWSLHPPYRGEDFFNRLPELVQQVEENTIPDTQRGDHDMNASMVDWSDALTALRDNRWWKRLLKKS